MKKIICSVLVIVPPINVEAESLGLEIHIAANSDGNLFKNLCIDSDGTLSLSKQAEAWIKKFGNTL